MIETPALLLLGTRPTILCRTAKNSLAARQSHFPAVDGIRSIFSEKPCDCDFIANLQRILSPALPIKLARSAALDRVVGYFSVFPFYINVVIDVRIKPFDLGHSPFDFNRLFGIVFCCERVVRKKRNCCSEQAYDQQTQHATFHRSSLPALKS